MWRTNIKKFEYPGMKPELTVNSGDMSKFGSKFWAARISGKDERFGLKRDFIEWPLKTKNHCKIKEPGVYEIFKGYGKSDEERYFILVEVSGGSISYKKIGKEEATSIVSEEGYKKEFCSRAAKSLRNEKSKAAARQMRCKCSPLPPCKGGLSGIGYLFGDHKK
jgi:hypothetical protein